MTSVRAGLLRQVITVQQQVDSVGAIGGVVKTWQDVATVRADVSPMSGRELLAAAAVQSEVNHEITIRWRPEFRDPKAVAAMRVLFGTRIFNIHACINQDERNRVIVLQAAEGLNNG